MPRTRPGRRAADDLTADGVLGAGFAIALRLWLRTGFIALVGDEKVLAAFGRLPRALRAVLPVLGGAAAGLVTAFATRRPGYGVGEVLEAVTVGRGQLPLAASPGTSAASFLAIVTGRSLGREGSIIQFGAGACADGTGAGFAAAYNTPLAAVRFVVEVVLGVATLGVVLPVVAGLVGATGRTRAALGSGLSYSVRRFALRGTWSGPLRAGAARGDRQRRFFLGAADGVRARRARPDAPRVPSRRCRSPRSTTRSSASTRSSEASTSGRFRCATPPTRRACSAW